MKTYQDLIDLGAPELPNDMYYVVSEDSRFSNRSFYIVVDVYQHRSFLGFRWVKKVGKAQEIVLKEYPKYAKGELVKACKGAAAQALKSPADFVGLADYFGTYTNDDRTLNGNSV